MLLFSYKTLVVYVLTGSYVAVAKPLGASESTEGSDQVSKAHVPIPAMTGFLAQAI